MDIVEFMDEQTSYSSGYTFKPTLQDISLKRFRLRYSTLNDCYYLHWDNAVCPQLSKIQGFENGALQVTGIERIEDSDKTYLTCDALDNEKDSNNHLDSHIKLSTSSMISWRLDFSQCGLAVKDIKIKAQGSSNESGLSFQIESDKETNVRGEVTLEDYFKEIPALRGSKVVTLTALLEQQNTSTTMPHLFENTSENDDCPLDIIINLMCPHPHGSPLVGEVLLGIKYSEHGASESLREKPDITVDCGLMAGQLQVHLVEGAGLVKEGSKKTLNSFLKCSLLPDPTNNTSKQTSPKNSAYPTWAKEFIFAGVDSFDLSQSGLEVLLYDKQSVFTNSIVGGVRLSIPQKQNDEDFLRKRLSTSTGNLGCVYSPTTSRCSSPTNQLSPPVSVGTPTLQLDLVNDILEQNEYTTDIELPLTLANGRPASFTLSTRQPLTPSPLSSPSLLRRVPVFTLPRSRDSPIHSSPRASPILGRKQGNKSPKVTPKQLRKPKTGFLYDWMDSKDNEISHWQNVIDRPNEWIYCWHVLRSKITPSSLL